MKINTSAFFLLAAFAGLAGCATNQTSSTIADTHAASTHANATAAASPAKSPKRGVAYDLASTADLQALSPGVSWWYNWGSVPSSGVPSNYVSAYGMTYYPMLWNGSFNKSMVESFIRAHAEIKYLLVLNEPNVSGQASCAAGQPYCSPAQAAALWPQYEAVAADTGVQIVGPQITWGTMPNYTDPVAWLDAFYTAYESANGGRQPRIDYLGFHWYDYGLDSQLSRLTKYGKPFWVTEFANWHSQNDGAQIDTLAKQETQMTDMVNTCENRADVFRYAWFTGRVSPDPHFSSLLAGQGQLTGLGQLYLSLAFPNTASAPVLIDSGSSSAQGSYVADTGFSGGATSSSSNTITLATSDTASQAVYQTNRYGNFTYTVGGFAQASTHTVKLHFAETYWPQSNQRIFNVNINGTTVLPNFDIVASAGAANKAVIQSFTTTANSSGQIVIQFASVKDNAQVNAIEVY